MDRAKKFQRIFAPYFPQLADDFHTACLEMEWIWYGLKNNPLQTVRKQKARRDLQRLMGTIRRLSECGVPYWMGVSSDILDEEAAEENAGTSGYYSVAGSRVRSWISCFR
jgi:hypothetical protein